MAEFVRGRVRLLTAVLTAVSLALVFGAVSGVVPRTALPRAPGVVAAIPHVNAALSLLAIGTILAGLLAIRRGAVARHRRAMLASLALFGTFLALYLYRVSVHGPSSFGGPEAVYTYVYLPLLAVHMVLAVVCIPLLYFVLLLAVSRPAAELPSTLHPRVGRVAAPLWLTSFALGVVVYGLLYVLY